MKNPIVFLVGSVIVLLASSWTAIVFQFGGLGLIIIGAMPLLALLLWGPVVGGRVIRHRLACQPDCPDVAFAAYFKKEGYPADLVLALRNDLAKGLRIEPTKLSPGMNVQEVLARPGVSILDEVGDSVLRAARVSSRRLKVSANLDRIRTVEDYVRAFASLVMARSTTAT